MTEAEPRRELIDQKPFVIRGHHLENFRDLTEPSFISAAEKARRDRQFLINVFLPRNAEYAQDILGLSTEDGNRYEEQLRKTYETFLALPDNYPVEIAEGIPDAICEACVIGKHCRNLGAEEDNFIQEDGTHLDESLKNLGVLKLQKPTIAQKQAFFFDAKPQQVRYVRTTIGVVKKVLKTLCYNNKHG